MAASAPAHDDYVTFCEGVRGVCDIDLMQYKRGQMERRVRSFAQRHGHERPGALPRRCCSGTPARATSSSTA